MARLRKGDKNGMTNVHAVVGAQYGDEGKGKMVDFFAAKARMVIRYQGGGNAGHTIVNEFGKFALHLVPSGIFHPETLCILGTGVVIHPMNLVTELKSLQAAGISTQNLLISERAHLVMPYHLWQDIYEEQSRFAKVGTTKQGIGPAYQDKSGRFGIQIGEMRDLDRFRERVHSTYEQKIQRMPGLADVAGSFAEMWEELETAREVLLPYITNTLPLVQEAVQGNQPVLLEGQLGIMRDIDWGVYPFVTSSSPISGGVAAGAGIPPTVLSRVTGIAKAYTTAVGAGPFPTQVDGEAGAWLRDKGQEYGATTGRPRTCGWLDLPTLRYGAWLNGYTDLALMKLDVLSGLPEIPVCVGYELKGTRHDMPLPAYQLEHVTPVYESLPGWQEDLTECRTFADLPTTAQAYVERIEQAIGVPVSHISVGPARQQTLVH